MVEIRYRFKSGSLKTDIKSLKKAARQAIAPELMRRVNKIIKSDDFKIKMIIKYIGWIILLHIFLQEKII